MNHTTRSSRSARPPYPTPASIIATSQTKTHKLKRDPCSTCGRCPIHLAGEYVSDEQVTQFLEQVSCSKGPFVYPKPVAWRDKRQKQHSKAHHENMRGSVTFKRFTKRNFQRNNVHIAWFQTRAFRDYETITAVRSTRSDTGTRFCYGSQFSPRRTRQSGPATQRHLQSRTKAQARADEGSSSREQKKLARPEVINECSAKFHVWGLAAVRDVHRRWHNFIFDCDAGSANEKNLAWTQPYWAGPVQKESQEYFKDTREHHWLSSSQKEAVKLLREKLSVAAVWIGDVDKATDKWRGECVRHTAIWIDSISCSTDDPFNPETVEKDPRFRTFRRFGKK